MLGCSPGPFASLGVLELPEMAAGGAHFEPRIVGLLPTLRATSLRNAASIVPLAVKAVLDSPGAGLAFGLAAFVPAVPAFSGGHRHALIAARAWRNGSPSCGAFIIAS